MQAAVDKRYNQSGYRTLDNVICTIYKHLNNTQSTIRYSFPLQVIYRSPNWVHCASNRDPLWLWEAYDTKFSMEAVNLYQWQQLEPIWPDDVMLIHL